MLSARYQLRYDPASLFRATGFTAGPDQVRLAEMLAALRDADARAIIMGRGGYGLLRILAAIEPDLLRRAGKPIVGFSDGTLLLAQAARAGLAAIHGPVVTPARATRPSGSRRALRGIGTTGRAAVCARDWRRWSRGSAQGPLLGGNLEVFSRMLGTPYLPDLRGAILFFEDVGERPYRIDRLLTQMELAGVFRAAAGVVAGRVPRLRRARCIQAGVSHGQRGVARALGPPAHSRGLGRAHRPRPTTTWPCPTEPASSWTPARARWMRWKARCHSASREFAAG